MDLDLGLIPGLLTLAEEKHYARAAGRLHLTPSALTRRVRRLERQLGAVLVERDPTGGVRLTAAGERFVVEARPLLAQAMAARQAALGTRSPRLIRMGFPAETNFQHRIDLAGLVRTVRRSHPEIRVGTHSVPFRDLTRSLSERRIDVLCTIAPVQHTAVDSFELSVRSARIGVVGVRHELAEAGSIDVETFAAQPMLFNPEAPREWMSPFWLGDVRPSSQARLVAIPAQDQAAVLRATVQGAGVISTLATLAGSLGPHLRPLTLVGAAPLAFYVAVRRDDLRGGVRALVGAFQDMPPQNLGAARLDRPAW